MVTNFKFPIVKRKLDMIKDEDDVKFHACMCSLVHYGHITTCLNFACFVNIKDYHIIHFPPIKMYYKLTNQTNNIVQTIMLRKIIIFSSDSATTLFKTKGSS